jgi:hypothetical protein
VGALWRGPVGRIFRVALAVLPLAWLFEFVSTAELGAGVQQLGVGRVAFAFALSLASYAFNALRWRVLLSAVAEPQALPSFMRLWRFNIEAAYFSLIPSGLAGDFMRGLRAQAHVSAEASYLIVLVERGLGLGALFVAAGVARLSAPIELPAAFDVLVSLGLAGTLVAIVAAPLVLRARPFAARWAGRFGPLVERICSPRFVSALALSFAISLAGQLVCILYLWTLARAWTPEAELLDYLQVVPLALLAIFVPITPGAMGQREVVFVWLFGFVGLTAANAVLLALCSASFGYVTAAAGGMLYFADLREARKARAAPSSNAT